VLATAADYFFLPWEIPIWVIISFVSLMIGGYFISTGIQKTGIVKKMPLGMGILAMFLIGSIAAFFGIIIYRVGMVASASSISYGGIIGTAVTFAGMFYLLMWTWQKKLSAGEIFHICLYPLASTFVLAAVIGTPTLMIAYNTVQKNARESVLVNQTMHNLQDIFFALTQRGVDRPPASLDVLVKEKLITADKLKSPANADRLIGFIYAPIDISYANREENQDKIIACDYKDNFDNYRVVLYANGKLQRLSEASFQDSLQQPVNKQLKQIVQKLETPQTGK